MGNLPKNSPIVCQIDETVPSGYTDFTKKIRIFSSECCIEYHAALILFNSRMPTAYFIEMQVFLVSYMLKLRITGGIIMFRLWGKVWKDNHLLMDKVICDDTDTTRTKKIFGGLNTLCYEFDLEKPIWLDSNISEFQKVSKTRFYQDNFIETIEFDYLEIQVIEED